MSLEREAEAREKSATEGLTVEACAELDEPDASDPEFADT